MPLQQSADPGLRAPEAFRHDLLGKARLFLQRVFNVESREAVSFCAAGEISPNPFHPRACAALCRLGHNSYSRYRSDHTLGNCAGAISGREYEDKGNLWIRWAQSLSKDFVECVNRALYDCSAPECGSPDVQTGSGAEYALVYMSRTESASNVLFVLFGNPLRKSSRWPARVRGRSGAHRSLSPKGHGLHTGTTAPLARLRATCEPQRTRYRAGKRR